VSTGLSQSDLSASSGCSNNHVSYSYGTQQEYVSELSPSTERALKCKERALEGCCAVLRADEDEYLEQQRQLGNYENPAFVATPAEPTAVVVPAPQQPAPETTPVVASSS
jgi:hypothetical protein